MTAGDVKFSLAISWRPVVWRSNSRASSASTSVSGWVSEWNGMGVPSGFGSEVGFEFGDLVDAAGVTAAFEVGGRGRGRRSPRRGRGRRLAPRSTAHSRRCARVPSGRCRGSCRARRGRHGPCWRRAARPGPTPPITMPTSASPSRTCASGGRTEGGVVDALGRVGAVVDDRRGPAQPRRVDQVLLELEAGMVGTEGDRVTDRRV